MDLAWCLGVAKERAAAISFSYDSIPTVVFALWSDEGDSILDM